MNTCLNYWLILFFNVKPVSTLKHHVKEEKNEIKLRLILITTMYGSIHISLTCLYKSVLLVIPEMFLSPWLQYKNCLLWQCKALASHAKHGSIGDLYHLRSTVCCSVQLYSDLSFSGDVLRSLAANESRTQDEGKAQERKRERGREVMREMGKELGRKSCVHLIPIHGLVYAHLLS